MVMEMFDIFSLQMRTQPPQRRQMSQRKQRAASPHAVFSENPSSTESNVPQRSSGDR